MSSSRSIAAARARRAGENANQAPPSRPVTSINSQAAFAQQYQGQRNQPQRMPQGQPMPQGRNVRVASATMAPARNVQTQSQEQPKPPTAKLSISDAIGLITLRLGRVESILMEKDHDNESSSGNFSIPENTQLVDKSVLANIVARIDSLEKNNRDFTSLMNDVKGLKEMFLNLDVKHDTFAKETNNRFEDYELALGEIEKQLPTMELDTMPVDIDNNDTTEVEEPQDILNLTTELETPIISEDLKSLIRNELAESS
jgi:hypothetical protein